MSYLILARKCRPQKFGDLTGQETTAKILQSAILQNRIAPSYLFSGPRGIGKTTCARIFAKALNCHNTEPGNKKLQSVEPCNKCSSCLEISSGSSIDVMEIDAASHTQVDNIREVIINTVAFAPVRDRNKIFIIDEVHMLSNHSFNALLKTLEEPPSHVVFILATTEFHKIPATIASRCQRFRFLPLMHKEILATLKKISGEEKIAVAEEALSLVARAASGSMRDALSLFDQVISHLPCQAASSAKSLIDLAKVEEILGVVQEDLLLQFIQKIAEKEPKAVLESIGNVLYKGYDLSHFLKEVREAFREMLIQKCGYADQDIQGRLRAKLPVDRFSLQELLRGAQLLTKCAEQMRWNDFPRMVFECYAVQLCQNAVGANELLGRLEKLEHGGVREKGIPGELEQKVPPFSPVGNKKSGDSIGKGLEESPNPAPGNQVQPSATQPDSTLEPSVVEEEERSASAEPENGGESWAKIVEAVHQLKPSLIQGLQMASVQWMGDKVELTVPKAFYLDAMKRNQGFMENLMEKILNRKTSLVLKLGETAKSVSGNEEVIQSIVVEGAGESEEGEARGPGAMVVESDLTTDQSPSENEVYEVIGDSRTTKEKLEIEDEGAKSFLDVFKGKVTRFKKSGENVKEGRPAE